MGRVEHFEDLIAWQKARTLTKEIYQLTRNTYFVKDFGLSGQIQRASVSVMSNIAEGFERGGRPEFHQFLVVAKASCAEVRSHLYVALDVGYIDSENFDKIYRLAAEVSRIIGGMRTAVSKQKEGLKNRTERIRTED